ncbi:sulfotransferase domain-containing protein [Prochlorococcus sp. MIT 1300]|uniref:sulfotransferase domain-containing protein n=1 Tax=Prochlorococcus sp. MIT 1300 TaxID=3096218 RepID=UPI002A74E7FF|nr:sulfotransferase domain-containing protein [Prochlorococcus sp. MIT 1300]
MSQLLRFLINGAQKSGTTALYNYLKIHPSLCLPKDKELHLFDNENRDWTRESIKQIDYEINHHFPNSSYSTLCGEATPVSLFWEKAPERIWRYNPDMKIISILRNPITRAYSHWNMEYKRGRDNMPFNISLEQEEKRCREALPLQHRVYSYLSRGFYSSQIKRLWRFFPREQTLILRQEELLNNPQTTLMKICKHLKVDAIEFPGELNSNSLEYIHLMPLEARKTLARLYKAEIRQLEILLGWDCSDWLKIS